MLDELRRIAEESESIDELEDVYSRLEEKISGVPDKDGSWNERDIEIMRIQNYIEDKIKELEKED